MLINELNKVFDEKINKLYRFTSGKTIVVWGYGTGGFFVEHLLKKRNRSVDCFIDNDISSRVHNPYYLRNIDSKTTVIIITFSKDDDTVLFLNSLGFSEGKNILFVKELFFNKAVYSEPVGYIRYLEANVPNLNFTDRFKDTGQLKV